MIMTGTWDLKAARTGLHQDIDSRDRLATERKQDSIVSWGVDKSDLGYLCCAAQAVDSLRNIFGDERMLKTDDCMRRNILP